MLELLQQQLSQLQNLEKIEQEYEQKFFLRLPRSTLLEEKTFVHTPAQFFQGFAVGLAVAAVVPAIIAGLIGYSILGLRGHYFAICTLGLGVAAGEISGGIEIIGAGQGFTTPPFPNVDRLEARGEFFYFCSFIVLVFTFLAVKAIYSTRFKLSRKREYLK